MSPDDARLRTDAELNRQRLVAAAAELFAERGMGVPLEDVAHRAAVGIGTLYRRFPDRGALIHAVVLDTLVRLEALACKAYDEETDAWEALRRFLDGCAELRAGGLVSTLDPRLHEAIRARPEVRDTRRRLLDVLARLVRRARRDGTLRPDVGEGDILLVAMMLTRRESALPETVSDALPTRLVRIALDGLRASPESSKLPDRRITTRRLDASHTRGTAET